MPLAWKGARRVFRRRDARSAPIASRASPMGAFTVLPDAFDPAYLRSLRRQIRATKWFTVNNLNRDFVGTRGFSVIFRREGLPRVVREFPYFGAYLDRVLEPDCNAFYLNPLELATGSRVDPHIDRSLLTWCAEIAPPALVSVLYVEIPPAMRGGRLVLARRKKQLGCITPAENTVVRFDGDLMHHVERMDSAGARLSLVCEQYRLRAEELEKIPEFTVQSRAGVYGGGRG